MDSPASPAMSFPDASLIDLVRAAQAGSEAAAQALMDKCGPRLRDYIRTMLHPPLRPMWDSEDMTQETFAKVFSHQFKEEVLASATGLWAYIKRIAENNVRDVQRKYVLSERRALDREVSFDGITFDGQSRDLSMEEKLLLDNLFEIRIADLLEALPSYQQVLARYFLKGCSTTDISRHYGMSRSVVDRITGHLINTLERRYSV